MKIYSLASSFIGGVMSFVLWQAGYLSQVEFLLTLSMCGFLPVILFLIGNTEPFIEKLLLMHPIFMLSVIGAFEFPWMSVLWLVYSFGLFLAGCFRMVQRGFFYIEETVLDMALIYLPLGAV